MNVSGFSLVYPVRMSMLIYGGGKRGIRHYFDVITG